MGPKTLADIRTQVRRRADMENSEFVSDSEINQYVQDSFGELYDLIIEAGGFNHFVNRSDVITTVAGTENYPILSEGVDGRAYKILKVQWLYSGQWRDLQPFQLWDLDYEDGQSWSSPDSVYYHFAGPVLDVNSTASTQRYLTFLPIPKAAHSVRALYLMYPPDLTDNSTMNFQGYTGWEEYIVCDAAAKCLEKEESDAAHLLNRKAAIADRIRWHASTMDHNSLGSVRDSEGIYITLRGEPYR